MPHEHIPRELRARRQWVVTALPTKRPVQVDGRPASSTDPETWNTFGACFAAAKRHSWPCGFVFTAQDPYAVIDLDHVRNPETGITEDWAAAIIDDLNSYSEMSMSGCGWHVIVRGQLTGERRKAGRVEIYDSAKVMTLTGDVIPFYGGEGIRAVDLGPLCKRLTDLDPCPPVPVPSTCTGPSHSHSGTRSEETAHLIGVLASLMRTKDASAVEREFLKRYPAHYHEQNKKHGMRGSKTYVRYSIERLLARGR